MDLMSADCPLRVGGGLGGRGAMMIEYMRMVILRGCGLRSARPQNPPWRGWDVRVSWRRMGSGWGCALKDNESFLFF